MNIGRVLMLLAMSAVPGVASSAKYYCTVEQKLDWGRVYSEEQLKAGKFSVKIEEAVNGAFLSRCSFAPSEGGVTCDRYNADKIVVDNSASIKKYYVFLSQFDVQLFADLSFVENNGRGSISYGRCERIAN